MRPPRAQSLLETANSSPKLSRIGINPRNAMKFRMVHGRQNTKVPASIASTAFFPEYAATISMGMKETGFDSEASPQMAQAQRDCLRIRVHPNKHRNRLRSRSCWGTVGM